VLVPDISARKVEIRYSFTGAQLLLFGAIVFPGGRPPNHPSDIVVVLRGPVQPILVREKQRILHIWMNADSNRFRSAPSFYSVASSRPISDLVDERTAAIYEMGLHNLQLSPGGGALPEKERRFEAGLLDLRRRQGLYAENARDTCAATDRCKRAERFKAERRFRSPVNGRDNVAGDNFAFARCMLCRRRTIFACRWIWNERAITERPKAIPTFYFQVRIDFDSPAFFFAWNTIKDRIR